MKKRSLRWMLVAVSMLSLVSVRQEVHATDLPGGCGGTWNTLVGGDDSRYVASGTKSCFFRLDGTPVYVYAAASDIDPNDPVSVRVSVYPKGNPELVLGNECSSSGSGAASCRKDDVFFPREVTPGLFEIRLPQFAGGTGISMECRWSFVGDRQGEAGCFGADHCPHLIELECQKINLP